MSNRGRSPVTTAYTARTVQLSAKPGTSRRHGRGAADQDEQSCLLLALPGEILREILCRVSSSPNSLINCMMVCKAWRDLLSDPEFLGLISSRATPTCLILPDIPTVQKCFKPGRYKGKYQSFEFKERGFPFQKIGKFKFPDTNVGFSGSCHGIICIRNTVSDAVGIANPVTGEYRSIHEGQFKCDGRISATGNNIVQGDRGDHLFRFASGFGFCSKTNQYKVVRIREYGKWEAKVLTLGSNRWRDIGDIPSNHNVFLPLNDKREKLGSVATHLDGMLHWLVYCEIRYLICTFDLGEEKFGSISMPLPLSTFDRPETDRSALNMWGRVATAWTPADHFLELAEMRDCLGVVHFDYFLKDASIDVWVMKEHGVDESWTKQFSIQTSMCQGKSFDDQWQVIYLDNEGIIFFIEGQLLAYNTGNGIFKKLRAEGVAAVAHVPTYLPLRTIFNCDDEQ